MKCCLKVLLLVICMLSVVFSSAIKDTKVLEYLNKNGEVCFKCFVDNADQIEQLTTEISICKVDNLTVYAYANEKEFERFLDQRLYYEVQPHPNELATGLRMSDNPEEIRQSWDSYPTYGAYEEMMYDFEKKYPDLCRIETIGTTVKNRKQLFAIISDNVNTDEPEPRFMYTSTMHGNETVAYVNFLRLIDYLLSNYSSDAEVKNLVDNIEIWIMPDENPDGTYRSGDHTVGGAVRANANGVDLNRNYPNPKEGQHPDGNQWQPEAVSFMELSDSLSFVISANHHSGAELLNYPFDTWTLNEKSHADDNWWQYVCRAFVDEVHDVSPSNYMDDMDNGVTNGGNWYIIYGSRMDYLSYYKSFREVTVELANTYMVDASSLPTYWNYLHKSWLHYIEQSLYGINGTVVDSQTINNTNKPISGVKIFVENHDRDGSEVYTKNTHGDYYRPIKGGTYTLTFSHDDYVSRTFKNVQVTDDKATVLNVKLWPVNPTGIVSNQEKPASKMVIRQQHGRFIISHSMQGHVHGGIYDVGGKMVKQVAAGSNTIIWDGMDASGRQAGNGCYILRLENNGKTATKNFILSR